jgi:hypothetical protein
MHLAQPPIAIPPAAAPLPSTPTRQPPAVQRTFTTEPAASAAATPGPPATAAPGADTNKNPAAGGTADGRTNLELDTLAAHLYERIAARLRTELRLDRERAGVLTDIRR